MHIQYSELGNENVWRNNEYVSQSARTSVYNLIFVWLMNLDTAKVPNVEWWWYHSLTAHQHQKAHTVPKQVVMIATSIQVATV